MEWKNALVKSRKLQALEIIQKSVTLELNLLVIRTCFSAILLPIEDNLNVDFENGILVDDAQSQIAGISEHITPKTHGSSTAELKLPPYTIKSTRREAQEPRLNMLA